MKKALGLILAILMVISLAACGDDKPIEPEKLDMVHEAKADERSAQGLGHYVDYVNRRGKIVDTRYLTSKKEVVMKASFQEEAMHVTINLGFPKVEPFKDLDGLALGNYKLMDANDQVIAEAQRSPIFPLEGKTTELVFALPADLQLTTGIYHFQVEYLSGEKNVDSSIDLVGPWSFTFAID